MTIGPRTLPWKWRRRASGVPGSDGDQQTRFIRWADGHAPGSVTVKADRPIRLVFERLDASVATDFVAIPSFGIISTIAETCCLEIGPRQPGSYSFSSHDGSLRGWLVVEP